MDYKELRSRAIEIATSTTMTRTEIIDAIGKLFSVPQEVPSKKINWIKTIGNSNSPRRSICHHLHFLTDDEQRVWPVQIHYDIAIKRANKIGGRKFHNRNYGGGISFQGWDTDKLEAAIIKLVNAQQRG